MTEFVNNGEHRHYQQYVGGDWNNVQSFSFEFIKQSEEFKTDMKFLDVGCGSLRLGARLIPELDANCYIGTDVSRIMIDKGRAAELSNRTQQNKLPRFIVNGDFNFDELNDEKMDYVWCYAVLIHLNVDLIDKCLSSIRSVMKDDAVFYSSLWPGSDKGKPANYRHVQPKESYTYDGSQLAFKRTWPGFWKEVYEKHGLSFEIVGPAAKELKMVKSVKI
jgi:SAM-dependent methyltransferase